MEKNIKIEGKHYSPGDLIGGDVLDVAGFNEKSDCTSVNYILLSNGLKKLILEVLGDEEDKNYKIYDIN